MIPAEELQIEAWPDVPKGGQHVSDRRRGVKVTHLPTGFVAISEAGRSPHTNREIAMDMLLAGLTHPKAMTDDR